MHLEMIEQLKTEDPKKVVEETWIPADNNWIQEVSYGKDGSRTVGGS